MNFGKEDFKQFLYSCFAVPDTRAIILKNWHARQPKEEKERASDYFVDFIQDVLYEPVQFHLYRDYFIIFGHKWPVYKRWFISGQKVFEHMHLCSETLFEERHEYENKQYDFSKPKDGCHFEVITREVRRQLVRDFVWMVWEKKNNHMWEEMIAAIQKIQRQDRRAFGDRFLSNLESACQSPHRVRITEVQCWNNSEDDLHTEVIRQRGK